MIGSPIEKRPPWAEHPKEFGEGAVFSIDVDQNRARGDDVDRIIGDVAKVVGRVDDEATAVKYRAPTLPSPRGGGEIQVLRSSRGGGELSLALSDELSRDVAEDHLAIGRNAVERPEADQAIPAADIEDDVPGLEGGAVEDMIASSL